jgi:hypothetical protein
VHADLRDSDFAAKSSNIATIQQSSDSGKDRGSGIGLVVERHLSIDTGKLGNGEERSLPRPRSRRYAGAKMQRLAFDLA